MAVPFSNTHLRVPRGFGAMLEGLTREILRDYPEDIPTYAAQYFETLLKKREEDRFHKSTEGEGSQRKNIMSIPLDDPEANRAATKIQAACRGYLTRKKLKLERKAEGKEKECSQHQNIMSIPLDDPEANRAATKIQAACRGYLTRKKLKLEHKAEGKEKECSQHQNIMSIPLDDPEADWAAAKIQAGVRGYLTRKKLKLEHKAEGKEKIGRVQPAPEHPKQRQNIMSIPLDDPEANRAAAKIQAGVRGYLTRKKLKLERRAEGKETSPSKETAAEVTISKEKSFEPRTEDESSHSEEVSQSNVVKKAEHTDKEEPVNRFPIAGAQSDEPSDTDKEHNPAITVFAEVDRAANETESSSVPDQNIPQTELEPTDLSSYRGLSNVDVCAQELRAAEDEEGIKRGPVVVDEELVDSGEEDNTEVSEQVKIMPYSGPADDVCAAELGGTERTRKGGTAEDVTHVTEEEENLEHQPEDILVESLVSQSEITENDQQVDQPENAKEERTETEACSGETHETLAHSKGSLDGNVRPKEGSLTEISFEDVPEAQPISEVAVKQPDEHGSIKALQMDILKLRKKEESEELTAITIGQYITDTQEHHKHEMERVETDVNEAKWTDDLTLSDDDEREKGENISSLNQHSTGAGKGNQEHETNCTIENNEKLSEAMFLKNEDLEKTTCSYDPDFKEGHMTDMVGGDNGETHEEGYSEMKDHEINDGGAENNSSQVTQSNTSMARMGAESEVFEESAQHQREENEGSQRTLVWLQAEDTVEEKEVTSKEAEELGKGMTDSEIQEKSDIMQEEENISLPCSADSTADEQQEEEGLLELEEDTPVPPESNDKEECSRAQEEEDIMDIPLDDPEANRAAAKIQAGFRGHMTRKKLKPEDKAEGEERQEDRGQ